MASCAAMVWIIMAICNQYILLRNAAQSDNSQQWLLALLQCALEQTAERALEDALSLCGGMLVHMLLYVGAALQV